MKNHPRIVIANWKLNPATLSEAKRLYTRILKIKKPSAVTVVVCPPYPYLSELRALGKKIALGAQNVFWEENGAHTGEVSGSMLTSAGARFVIVGHSERRAAGETDEMVNKKLTAAFSHHLTPILCIGEKVRDTQGTHLSFLRLQLTAGLAGISKQQVKALVIAYEPVWAIGKTAAQAMQPHDMHEMVLYIRKILSGMYGTHTARAIPVLYGGSVEPQNAPALISHGESDGFLVGHASLNAHDFESIIAACGARS
jgi:triosephosphate isomerase